MAQTRRLNGLPNSLIEQYFSTLYVFYWNNKHTSYWIWHSAIEKSVIHVEIDVLNKRVEPRSLDIAPITEPLKFLQETIKKNLSGNGFKDDFIISAYFDISISEVDRQERTFSCKARLVDLHEKVYKSKLYTQKVLE